MHWNSFSEFLTMGNHGLYVWGSFVVMAALMIVEPIWLAHTGRKLRERLRRRYRAEAPGGRAATPGERA
jgi:heme exporter protein D